MIRASALALLLGVVSLLAPPHDPVEELVCMVAGPVEGVVDECEPSPIAPTVVPTLPGDPTMEPTEPGEPTLEPTAPVSARPTPPKIVVTPPWVSPSPTRPDDATPSESPSTTPAAIPTAGRLVTVELSGSQVLLLLDGPPPTGLAGTFKLLQLPVVQVLAITNMATLALMLRRKRRGD